MKFRGKDIPKQWVSTSRVTLAGNLFNQLNLWLKLASLSEPFPDIRFFAAVKLFHPTGVLIIAGM